MRIVKDDDTRHAGETPLARLCRQEMERLGLNQTQAARAMGVSGTRLSQWLRGIYGGDLAVMDDTVKRWLATQHDLEINSIDAAPVGRHVRLAVTDEICRHVAYAHATGDVVAVTGAAGTGKTWAARHYCGIRVSAHCVEIPQSVTTLRQLMWCIGDALGLDRARSAFDMETAIVRKLQGVRSLLVIDGAHRLSRPLLDALRSPRDGARCGVALLGRDGLQDRLDRCEELSGHLGACRTFGQPYVEDVQAIVSDALGRRATASEADSVMGKDFDTGGLLAVRRRLVNAWNRARLDGRDAIAAADLVHERLGVTHVAAEDAAGQEAVA